MSEETTDSGAPRFSLVAICRDGAGYVVRCLAAIAQQTFDLSRVEVVFVDDGSSDFSGDIAEKYGEELPRFKLVRTGAKDGSGCGGARNAGLAAATGEYVWHIDVDDWITPDALTLIDGALSKAEKAYGKPADVCVFPYRIDRRPGSRHKGGLVKPPATSVRDGVGGAVAAWAKVIRRERAVELPVGQMAQDAAWHFAQWDRFERFASVGGDKPLYVYDRTNQTATSNTQEWTVVNPRTLEQLAFGDEAAKLGLKDRFFSDAIRALADMYDVRHRLRKPWVRAAWAARFRSHYASIMTGRFTH